MRFLKLGSHRQLWELPSKAGNINHLYSNRQHFEWLNTCFFFEWCRWNKRKKKVRVVNTVHSNTINEPYTFEQELTHLPIPVCWFLFINFSCHLFEATPQQGVRAGGQLCAVYLCHQRWHPPDTFASLAFQGDGVLKGAFCLETILSFCQGKRADILRKLCL